MVFGDRKIVLSQWVFLPVSIIALFLWFSGIVVALRTTVKKAAPKRVPAIAEQMPVLAAAVGGTQTGLEMHMPVPASAPEVDERQRETNEPSERRRAGVRRTIRRRADAREGGTRTVAQAPKAKGVRLVRGRGGWRRRTG